MADADGQVRNSVARMPALFMGHGSPMNAIEDNRFSRAWTALGASLPRPEAIFCISAHWETQGTQVTTTAAPATICDFHGFPPALSRFRYPAPGATDLAERIGRLAPNAGIRPDPVRGLDHGAWSVLCRLFPAADIPVAQLSLARDRPESDHLHLGEALAPLRDEGVMILGSGNIVHNLQSLVWADRAYDWAEAFDDQIRQLIRAGDREAVACYRELGPNASLAVPTPEHFLPLLYVLGAARAEYQPRFYCEEVTLASISMTCLMYS